MNEQEFFTLVGNETRRQILRSIAREPKYLFQLSQELNKSQQSLQRHLQCLLEKGWLSAEVKPGPFGPARKIYQIAKNLSVRITLSENSFDFDVFEISMGDIEETIEPRNHVEALSKDLPRVLDKVLNEKDLRMDFKIKELDKVLDQVGVIENFLLSRKITITGELNETISTKLEGDAYRKDRELAYTLYSRSAPIKVDFSIEEIKTNRHEFLELLASLELLNNKNLLPEEGKVLRKKIERAISLE